MTYAYISFMNPLFDIKTTSHVQVKIIIIDSIAFHFRHGFSDMALRTRILNSLAQDLTKIAHSFNLAVCDQWQYFP